MAESSVRWFCFNLPVLVDAEEVDVGGVPSKFWHVECDTPKGLAGPIFRTQRGHTIQERLDFFLKHDASQLPQQAYEMLWARRVVPASPESVSFWIGTHQWIPELKAARA